MLRPRCCRCLQTCTTSMAPMTATTTSCPSGAEVAAHRTTGSARQHCLWVMHNAGLVSLQQPWCQAERSCRTVSRSPYYDQQAGTGHEVPFSISSSGGGSRCPCQPSLCAQPSLAPPSPPPPHLLKHIHTLKLADTHLHTPHFLSPRSSLRILPAWSSLPGAPASRMGSLRVVGRRCTPTWRTSGPNT